MNEKLLACSQKDVKTITNIPLLYQLLYSFVLLFMLTSELFHKNISYCRSIVLNIMYKFKFTYALITSFKNVRNSSQNSAITCLKNSFQLPLLSVSIYLLIQFAFSAYKTSLLDFICQLAICIVRGMFLDFGH